MQNSWDPSVVHAVLHLQDTVVDVGLTGKLRTVFKAELQRASLDGTLNEFLHTLVDDMCDHTLLDTQEIEGTNSIVKATIAAAPSITIPLLSARPVKHAFMGTTCGLQASVVGK
jgi:hypothetical protein